MMATYKRTFMTLASARECEHQQTLQGHNAEVLATDNGYFAVYWSSGFLDLDHAKAPQ